MFVFVSYSLVVVLSMELGSLFWPSTAYSAATLLSLFTNNTFNVDVDFISFRNKITKSSFNVYISLIFWQIYKLHIQHVNYILFYK